MYSLSNIKTFSDNYKASFNTAIANKSMGFDPNVITFVSNILGRDFFFWEGGRGVICLHPIFRAAVELGTAVSQLVIILLVPYPSLGLTNGLKITPVNSLVS